MYKIDAKITLDNINKRLNGFIESIDQCSNLIELLKITEDFHEFTDEWGLVAKMILDEDPSEVLNAFIINEEFRAISDCISIKSKILYSGSEC